MEVSADVIELAVKVLCAGFLVVGIGSTELKAERGRITGINVVQICVLAGVLRGLRRACRGICGAGGVPLSRVCQTQAVVIGDGIVHADSVFVVDTIAAVAGLVAVGHALSVEGMVGLMLHLSVTRAIGVGVRCVYTQLAMVIDDAATRIAGVIFVLPPTAHQLP